MKTLFSGKGRVRPWLAAALLWGSSVADGAQPPDQTAIPLPAPEGGTRPATVPTDAAKDPADRPARNLPATNSSGLSALIPPTPTMLAPTIQPIDLNTALRLAGVQNPELMIARQRVVEAAMVRQLAAAQFLPTINLGGNYDAHTGALQQSNGNMLSVNRSAVYVGAGSNAVAAGTVNIPGLVLTGNVATALYGYLTTRQVVVQREFATLAIRNQAFLQTCLAYCELLRAEGDRAVAMQVRDEGRRVAQLADAYARSGQATKADANRAATHLAQFEANFQAAEGRVLVASARLCEVLNLDPSIRLHPTDAWVVPTPVVPDPMPVAELIAIALVQRPELGERRAAIRESFLALEGSKVLPFSPTILLAYSAGGFGGGSNLVRPVFGGFGGRTDLDVYAYWSIQNMGVGNLALINLARARLGVRRFEQVAMLDHIRAEVAEAYARSHARFHQIGTAELAVRSGMDGFREDLLRIEGFSGLPIELLDSLSLLAESRYRYLAAIVDYNEAQFQLYVAMGQPPADALSHPVPTAGVVPRGYPVPVPPTPRPAPAANRAASNAPTLSAPAPNPAPEPTVRASYRPSPSQPGR